MFSVIIPAHNEAAVIRRGLEYLLAGARPGELEVVVACNGCIDDTAAIAREFGPPVQVLEIPTASKIAALNAADAVATAYPRVYMDADVRLDISGVRRIAQALERSGALLAAPKLRMDLRRTSWFVRGYYEVWTRLPYNQTMVGTGVYALSSVGRARFDRFPDLIADDGFVRFQFTPQEREMVPGTEVWVDPPQTLWGLIKIKTRSRLGQYQLRQRMPGLCAADPKPPRALLRMLLAHPVIWSYAPAYLGVNLVTRWRARRQLRSSRRLVWERADTPR